MRPFSTTPSSAGLDMAIVNAGQLDVYEEIAPELPTRVEDVLLNRRPDATERLVELAGAVQERRHDQGGRAAESAGEKPARRNVSNMP